jgi:hypothetical protein
VSALRWALLGYGETVCEGNGRLELEQVELMTGSYQFSWRKSNLAMRHFLGLRSDFCVGSGLPEVKGYQPFSRGHDVKNEQAS